MVQQMEIDFDAAARQQSVANRNSVYHNLDSSALSGMRQRILEHLRQHGPATREEVAIAFGKQVHQISGRFTALLSAGLIEETGQRRPTRSGHQAVVVRACQ